MEGDAESDVEEENPASMHAPSPSWLSGETTTNVGSRIPVTNDLLAVILVASLPVLIYLDARQLITLSETPERIVFGYLTAVGVAVVWTFGKDPLVAWMDRK